MKTMNRIFLAATTAVALTSVGQVMAQSQMTGPGGIAASPRVTQMTLERTPLACKPATVVSPTPVFNSPVAASPRVQQMSSEKPASALVNTSPTVVTSSQHDTDNIAASPKLREQLNERPVQFQIAPVK
jgi:hypothetical protein